MVVLDSLGQILRGSPNTRIFLTGRPHVRREIERWLGGGAIFISIEPMDDDVLRYLREKFRNDTTPEIMNSKLEVDILKSIPEASSETCVREGAVKKLLEGNCLTYLNIDSCLFPSISTESCEKQPSLEGQQD